MHLIEAEGLQALTAKVKLRPWVLSALGGGRRMLGAPCKVQAAMNTQVFRRTWNMQRQGPPVAEPVQTVYA